MKFPEEDNKEIYTTEQLRNLQEAYYAAMNGFYAENEEEKSQCMIIKG